jgi:RNAse (barnase) inhibitor barstar
VAFSHSLRQNVIVELASGPIILTIDGAKFSDLDGFFDEVSDKLFPTRWWGRNLNAFNDILRGGFGTPDVGFELRWLHSEVSRTRLGAELFGTILDIVKTHGPSGAEAEDGVLLSLM